MPEITYWAALPPDQLGKRLVERISRSKAKGLVKEVYERLAIAYHYYFGYNAAGEHVTSGVLRAGDQGELAEVRVNHCRSLVNTLLNLITSAKVVWNAKATNSDLESRGQCIIASSLLEYYWQEQQVAKYAIRACEEAIAFTEGFVLVEWDESLGEPVLAYEGEQHTGGDVKFTNLSTWDVFRDPNKKSWDELDWVVVRVQRNKYDLAAQYPDQAEHILLGPADSTFSSDQAAGWQEEDCDDLFTYKFFHKRTPAMPNGAEACFLPDGTVLHFSQEGLTYDEIPVYRVAPAELIGSPYGYSPFLEVLGIQEVIDSLHSAIATNQTTFSLQNIVIPQGSDVPVDHLAGGMRVWSATPGMEPKALELCKTPAESFSHLADLKRDQEQLFGVNDVVRGSPEGSTRSGKALALLQSQALQQANTLQQNYLRFVESIGMAVLRLMQTRATTDRRVAITGKANQFLQREESFNGQSISKVKKVLVEIGNPLSQTAAGREQLADKFIQLQLIKTPEQLEQVLTIGRIEPLTQGLQNELLLITAENEMIQRGETPPAMLQDDALLHCREHRPTMANPETRSNPQVVAAFTEHMHLHYSVYFGVPDPLADPQYLERMRFLTGLGPMPQPLAPPLPPTGTPGPQGGQPSPSELAAGNEQALPPPPGPPESDVGFPENPATGETWDPTTGGGIVSAS